MKATLSHFFYMGGHGLYVWGAYGSVIFLLAIQWLVPMLRFKNYLRKQNKLNNQNKFDSHKYTELPHE